MKYPVTSIFKTLQGEGHFVGYPAVFIRLAGCSVTNCSIRKECDEAPWKATETLDLQDVVSRVRVFGRGIVVITGGEPTDHDLVPLVDRFHEYGMRVHLETSGERSIEGAPFDWVTVSPKTPAYQQRTGHTLKVVVRPGWGWDEIAQLDVGTSFFHRYLQPMAGPEGTNLPEVISLLLQDRNIGGRWALSTQAHKTWGMQ